MNVDVTVAGPEVREGRSQAGSVVMRTWKAADYVLYQFGNPGGEKWRVDRDVLDVPEIVDVSGFRQCPVFGVKWEGLGEQPVAATVEYARLLAVAAEVARLFNGIVAEWSTTT